MGAPTRRSVGTSSATDQIAVGPVRDHGTYAAWPALGGIGKSGRCAGVDADDTRAEHLTTTIIAGDAASEGTLAVGNE